MTRLTTDYLPQPSGLLKIRILNSGGVSADFTHPLLVLGDGARDGTGLRVRTAILRAGCEVRWLQRGTHVVRVFTVVIGEVHEAITLEGTVDRDMGFVGGEHLVVCTKTVAGCVGIGEHASLEHCFNTISIV